MTGRNEVCLKSCRVHFDRIVNIVSQYYQIPPELILAKTRKREIVDARHMVMYLAKKYTDLPAIVIGTRLCRSHASVLHAYTSVDGRLSVDRQLRLEVEDIEAILFT